MVRSKSIRRSSALTVPKISTFSEPEVNLHLEDQELIERVQSRFASFASTDRKNLIISLIKLSDPNELRYLKEKMPRLHHDFLTLLPSDIKNRILVYVNPRDFCSIVCVSKTWQKIASDVKAWETIYSRLGNIKLTVNPI